jgi:hypothetical protein
MSTKEIVEHETRENCSSEWTTLNGVNVRIFTGSNGGSIFLPAAGRRWFAVPYSAGRHVRAALSPFGRICNPAA